MRKPIQVGCLNLVLKSGRSEEPHEYIPTGLMSNHAQWDSQWFYLRNDEGLLPTYTGRLITARSEHWMYGVPMERQPRLRPLLGALKCLHEEGLTVALIFSAIHHRQVLPLMARPLRMDEMGPRAAFRDLEACQMSKEVLPDEEVAARVRAAVSGTFWVKDINAFERIKMPKRGGG